MKKIALLLLFLAFGSLCYGQNNHFQYKTEKIDDEIGKFLFPIFSNFANPVAAVKANQMLQISELEILKGFETNNIFERVMIDDGRIYGGKTDIDFEIYDNNSKVLSVKLNQSSCGATCNYWVKYYNFNSGNGDLIQLKDLFTEKGYEKFFAFAAKRRTAQLNKEINKLPPAERRDFEDIGGSYETDDLTDFYIRKNLLYLDGENSFNKGQKFSSLEIDKISQFSLSEFQAYLNDYGKSLFGLNNNAVKQYRSSTLPQLFQGKIGGQNVSLVLNKSYENEMKAEYVYLKYGKGIFLEGAINKTELTLTEKLPQRRDGGFVDYVDNGFIKAEFNGQSIVGTWTSGDKTKTSELHLTRR